MRAIALIVLLLSRRHDATAIPLAQYRVEVHQARVAADAQANISHPSNAELGHIGSRLRSLGRVRIGGGRVVKTSTPSLARYFSGDGRRSVDQGAAQLDALDDLLSSGRMRAASKRDLRTLDTVLRDPRFHPYDNPVQRFIDWVGGRIGDLLRRIRGILPSPNVRPVDVSPLDYGFVALVFLLLVGSVGYLLARGALRRVVVDAAVAGDDDEPGTAIDAGRRVDGAVAQGDYRTALRYLLLATLLELQERRMLTLRPGATNRVYLHSLRENQSLDPQVRENLKVLVDAFDRTWYGHGPIDATELEHCRAAAGRVVRPRAA